MNFAPPDGYLALDGSECDLATHWPWDPCTYLMPELGWEYRCVCVCMRARVRVRICGCGYVCACVCVCAVSVSCTLGASGNMLGEYVYLQISPLKLCAATPAPAPQLLGSVLCTRNIVGVDLVVFVLLCFRSATTFSSQ
jgi:hypothetical protein